MYAIMRCGGKQYKVAPGDVIRLEKLAGEPGAVVEFNHVLAARTREVKFGTPLVENAKVTGTILRHGRGDKIRIIKYKKTKQYRRTAGHRQDFSEVMIKDIVAA